MAKRINQTVLTDALEREFAARQTDRISRPVDLRRLGRTWGRARRAARRALPHDQPAARLVQLTLGLLVYGVSEALMLAPSVGVDPWDVFHTGLARITGIPVGTVLMLIGGVVLLLWIPLRQSPGVGTVANIFVIGVAIDVLLVVMPVPHAFWLRWGEFVAGVALNAVATGLYIGAGLGAGPRDGLTTGLGRRGRSIRVARTGIELSVLAAGWLLGGNVGAGTVVYAVGIGPLVHVTIPWFARERVWPGALSRSPSGS
ncbi:MAG TPA: hypothetical protein VGS97_08865 [Actinocrinis sp.]|uniref:membrane protein YczE n=1 Tax=Actinocrinis sp. TaxID=1920516 RepID=UPI002DDCDF18|nr:hypothetical protein [Actinocrinis sp.]HEV2344189.1 hypothetical protein [Actinocrinis sp.]